MVTIQKPEQPLKKTTQPVNTTDVVLCWERRWQTDSAVPEHSNRWLLELLNTATRLSHIAYKILIKFVCVPGHIFSAFISHASCISV